MSEIVNLNLDFLPENRHGIYLVGGTVRDLLMGRKPADIDLAIRGDFVHIAATIADKCQGKVVDLGKKGFAVLRVASPSLTVDITPLAGQTIEDNLRQRDFTINAIAYDVADRRLVDCSGGPADLKQKTVRMVSDTVFTKDPARLVRAYRMAAMLEFGIDLKTRAVIGGFSHLISQVAGERIWAELLKLFTLPQASPIVRQMADDGLMVSIFPELKPSIGCIQNHFHQFDVFEHSLRTYEQVEMLLADLNHQFAICLPADEMTSLLDRGALMKYAALLHDAGKPATKKKYADGRVGFPGHAGRSATLATTVSERLRLSKVQRDTSVSIIRNHIRPLFLFLAMQKGTLSHRGTIRFFNHCGSLTLPILVHSIADILAKHQTRQPKDADFISFCHGLMGDYVNFRKRQSAGPPLVNGHDLIKIFGLFPTPRFKWILSRVDEHRLSGELSTREQALAWVKAQLASRWGDGAQTAGKKS